MAHRRFRANADDIDPDHDWEVKNVQREKLMDEMGDPWLFNLFVSERE